ncbi:hypothetical protein SAMN05920897_10578 [Alkalispirochaeta americana]|uniref:Uncharacterized protein n=1 Tax=Alkalispirochaeta americana TaxID=159291 RepID=A0A1N6QWY8_9SPIO|nr:hypothetical protein SAMN05920897_10578 [Alkalispirochaeta americana]
MEPEGAVPQSAKREFRHFPGVHPANQPPVLEPPGVPAQAGMKISAGEAGAQYLKGYIPSGEFRKEGDPQRDNEGLGGGVEGRPW